MTRSAVVLVVIDANVFVSAAIQRGASYRIVESWLTGTADCLSAFTVTSIHTKP